MKKRTALAGILCAAGGICLLRSEYEKDQLVVDDYVIKSPKITAGRRVFAFLTDLHDKEFGTDNERLISIIENISPDAVLVGGDTMTTKGRGSGDLKVSLKLLLRLAEDFPLVLANGNHEQRLESKPEIYEDKYAEYVDALERAGASYLSDSVVSFGEDILIYGVDLPYECYSKGYPSLPEGFLAETLGPCNEEKFSILLAHSPLFFDEYASWGADLTLAGHFHGGTIRLPVLGGVMTPQYQFFYPYCAGMAEKDGKRMIVGRGLGTHSIPVRINNKPQVVVVVIEN